MIEIKAVESPEAKADICNRVLRSLPSWFGIEQAIVDYVREAASMPFLAAFEGDAAVGFIALKEHNRCTAEVYVMGVLEEYHRRGVGGRLVSSCEDFCRANGFEFLTVKTLDESREDAGYEKTRRFYLSAGFRPIEVFPLLWGEENPCLFMAKHLG